MAERIYALNANLPPGLRRQSRQSRAFWRAFSTLAVLRAQPQNSIAILGREALVEPIGIEPMTPCLQSRCSPS